MNDTTSLLKKISAIKGLNIFKPRKYSYPTLDLLKDYTYGHSENEVPVEVLEDKMAEFGLQGEVVHISRGPVVTRYEIRLAKGVKLSQVRTVSEDLAIALMTQNVRIQAPIPGTSLVGIEFANDKPSTIALKAVLSKVDREYILPLAVGVTTTGEAKTIDLAKMPHLLVAGATGSGKSVCLNSIILSILYTKTPEECRLVLIDPKRVELAAYRNIPHLWRPVVNDPEMAAEVFESLIEEMESRYKLLERREARNIESFNAMGTEKMPYIVVVCDELADLLMTSGKALEKMIVRLAQLARAVGIHLVLATQKPIVSVITGLIKSNMPSRIAFQVACQSDSRVILDCNGAEKLIGRGDMLMMYPGLSEPVRAHGAWVSDEEVRAVTTFIKRGI
jgi:S-DNA-T family DNA segregation ATPase FtsK/SpoIIIE